MKEYSIFDLSGRLVKSVQSTESIDFNEDLSDKIVFDKYVPPNTYFLDISTNSLVPLGPRPSTDHVFDYTTKTWISAHSVDQQWQIIRDKRNELLQSSDWTQLPDVPIRTKEAWATYRQQLRDITNQTDPFNIVWPIPPS